MFSLQKILWRALRGNLLFHHMEVDEPSIDKTTENGDPVYEDVFIVMVHGMELVNKIKKICDTLGASLYNVSEDKQGREKEKKKVDDRLSDLKQVLDNTRQNRNVQLAEIQKDIDDWSVLVRKEKNVYSQMNLFKSEQQSLIAEGWIPTNKIEEVKSNLLNAMVNEKKIIF